MRQKKPLFPPLFKVEIFKIPGVLPVFAVFFAESLVLGNWIPRIPDVKLLFELSASSLGFLLLIMSSGTFVSFLGGGVLIKKWGLRKSLILVLPLWSLLIGLVPFVPHTYGLAVLLFFAGIAVGMAEIGINTAADKMEQQCKRRLMSKAHGFWSLGSLVGALVGTKFANFDFSVAQHFAVITPISVALALISSVCLPRFPAAVDVAENDNKTEGGKRKEHSKIQLPHRSIVLLCLMPIGIMITEGAFIDWSALFMRDILMATPWQMGGIFVVFSAVMTVVRLGGDRILDRYGAYQVCRISCICTALGVALFATAPTISLAFLGAVLSGAGVAIVYPLAMSAVARRPGLEEDNVAAMSLFAFMALMLAPPIIGFITDIIGLRWALTLLIPLAIVSVYLSKEVKREDHD